VLQRFGPAERLGMDEVFVDVSELVEQRLAALGQGAAQQAALQVRGHVYSSSMRLHADTRHRPQDLRALPKAQSQGQGQGQQHAAAGPAAPSGGSPLSGLLGGGAAADWAPRLAMGSVVADEARRAVRQEAGFRWVGLGAADPHRWVAACGGHGMMPGRALQQPGPAAARP
jgi:hypothetical protein